MTQALSTHLHSKELNVMNFNHFCVVASMAALTGCATEVKHDEGDHDAPNAAVSQSLTQFTFDSTALVKRPTVAVPTRALTLDKHTDRNIAEKLLGSKEVPTRIATQGSSAQFRTTDWEFENDPATGRLMGYSLRTPTRPVPQDEKRLQADAVARLGAFGVGTEEVGTVLQRKVMTQDMDGTAPAGAPELHSYKTFVFRSVNGIPVIGHRAVISHAADGSVRKVLMNWPALAKSGHQLRTALADKDIETRAADALARSGETTGKATLTWRYQPVRAANGEVTLKLIALAKIDGAMDTDGTTEETRFVEVDVAAQ